MPWAGAMKTMVTGNAYIKAKVACTMQHASLSMMQGCQAGSLSALEEEISRSRCIAEPGTVSARQFKAGQRAHGMAGKRRYGRQAGQWGLAGFGGSCSLGGSALFQGTPARKLFKLL